MATTRRPARRDTARTDRFSTREALLRAGTDLFASRGFDGATVDAIAGRAGANRAMIKYYFGGKKGLYGAILESIFCEAARELVELRRSERTPPEQLREFVAIFSRIATSRPAFPAMILREVISGGRHLDDETLPQFLNVFGHVRRIVDHGVKEGAFRPVNPLLTHLTLIGSLVFFFATAPFRERLIREGLLPPAIPTGDGFVRHLQELMTRGLAADPETPDATHR